MIHAQTQRVGALHQQVCSMTHAENQSVGAMQ